LQVHAYASNAQIPLKDVAITVTAKDGTALASRLTDRSGRIAPIVIPTPDIADSRTPGSVQPPFTAVTLHARLQGYEQIRIDGLQVFPDTITLQDLEMIPLSELPSQWSKSEQFTTQQQNL
jgi:hypothetical protein